MHEITVVAAGCKMHLVVGFVSAKLSGSRPDVHKFSPAPLRSWSQKNLMYQGLVWGTQNNAKNSPWELKERLSG
jgi:hypothetical protein